MTLCIKIGHNTIASGICCVAIGDNTVARGAYRVAVGEKITLPEGLTKAHVDALIPDIKEMLLVYKALSEQGVAPADFGTKAEQAVAFALNSLSQIVEPKEEKEKPDAQ